MSDVLMIGGKPETILTTRDFEYLVNKYMGYEAAEYFRLYAENADEEVRAAEAGENTDLASYEASLESNTRAFQDIEGLCREMISDFNKEQGRNRLAALRPWRDKVEKILKIAYNYS